MKLDLAMHGSGLAHPFERLAQDTHALASGVLLMMRQARSRLQTGSRPAIGQDAATSEAQNDDDLERGAVKVGIPQCHEIYWMS